jgi:tetratricopeptide (TPR) repeat protein
MLLDFNLSFDTTAPDRDLVGGTIPYMATEQLLDLKTRGRGQVDARTDLYALGVMAFEMLTGTVPFPASSRKLADIDALIAAREKGPPSVRELNPDVTPAVESIVRKLLAPDPKDRYQTAEELRTDAERHLNDLPLRFAAEPSVRERFGKWKRRNPGVFGRLIAACLLGLVVGLGGVVHMRAESHARAAAAARVKSTHTALDQVRLDLVLPGDPAARARGIARAEEVLAAYALPDDPDWTKRPEVRLLSEQDRAALTGDLGELMLLLAQVKWQGAAGRPGADPKDIAAEAMKLNRAAGECFADGARPAMLDRQAADLAAALGEEAPAAAPRDANAAPTARDLFLEAAGAVARSDYAAALKTLEATLKEQPGHAAAQFCLAYCRYQLGQYERALEGFDVAERMLPPDPRPAFQRGVIYGMKRYHKEAEEQYSRAINLDPEHAAAHRNRGLARLRIGQQLKNPDGKPSEDGKLKLREAEADLTQALELGASPYPIYSYREQARRLLGEVAGADADKRLLAKLDPSEEADFISRGKAREEARDFEGALADYRAAARVNPRSLTALHNQICILADVLSRNEEALAVANRLADLYPNYAVGRAGRAVLLARLGRRADAHAEAEQARKLCKDPEVTYQAACVYALTAKDNPDDRVMAVALLERALKDGYRNVTGIKTDPDLDSLHQDERFIEMLRAAETLFQ